MNGCMSVKVRAWMGLSGTNMGRESHSEARGDRVAAKLWLARFRNHRLFYQNIRVGSVKAGSTVSGRRSRGIDGPHECLGAVLLGTVHVIPGDREVDVGVDLCWG
jgi:hypothetical protein